MGGTTDRGRNNAPVFSFLTFMVKYMSFDAIDANLMQKEQVKCDYIKLI
jgi:hypothetical protein